MKCPYCNLEMTKGFLISNRNLCFTKNKDIMFLLGKEALSLGSFWKVFQEEAYRCEACEVFIFKNPKAAKKDDR